MAGEDLRMTLQPLTSDTRPISRAVTFVMAAGLVLALTLGPFSTVASAETITLAPGSGSPGTVVEVSLVDFTPCLALSPFMPGMCILENSVNVYFAAGPTPVATASAPAGWMFFPNPLTFSVPAVSGGTYTVTAIDAVGRTASASFVVLSTTKASQSITFGALDSKVYGDPDFSLSASASSGLSVSFVATGSCTIVAGPSVHLQGTGQCAITASQGGNETYNAAADVRHEFNVTRRIASVTPTAASKTYGDGDPELAGTLAGFLPSDGVVASYSRAAGESVGSYHITATLGPSSVLTHYEIAYHPASFTISPRAAAVTPNASGKTYGAPDPLFTGVMSGFLAADGVTATYTRTGGEAVGNYTISATLTPASQLANYSVTYNTSVFTITITPGSLCGLTSGYVRGSAKYVALPQHLRMQSEVLIGLSCDRLASSSAATPSRSATAIAVYKQLVEVLRLAGYLTLDQAAFLKSGADQL